MTQRLGIWFGVFGLLLFASGVVAGIWLTRPEVAARSDETAVPSDPSSSAATSVAATVANADLLPEYSQSWVLRSEETLLRLCLDEEQNEKIHALLSAHYREDHKLRNQRGRLADETHRKLLEHLNPTQRGELASIQKRYARPHIEAEVYRELNWMRRNVKLSTDQEPSVFQITFDSFVDQCEVMKGRGWCGNEKEQRKTRATLRELVHRRLERLSSHLSDEQMSTYRNFVEQRRKKCEARCKKNSKKSGAKKTSGAKTKANATDTPADSRPKMPGGSCQLESTPKVAPPAPKIEKTLPVGTPHTRLRFV
ncbi:MAG: hypothetical protein AAF517_14205 [Planctomycetota bacterium]